MPGTGNSVRHFGVRALLPALCLLTAAAQDPPAQTTPAVNPPPGSQLPNNPPPQPVNPNAPETTTRDEAPTFKTRVNLVSVPVVVRDRQGRAVGGLQLEDFQLFDKNKLQTITKFSVEKAGARQLRTDTPPPKPGEGADGMPADTPDRFVAYLIDDVHISFGDLVRVRTAAQRHIATLSRTDRASIMTTSGRNGLEFTDDRDRLQEALGRIMPSPIQVNGVYQCPDISYYMADLIQNKNDTTALSVAVQETMICANLDQTQRSSAEQMVRATTSRVLSTGDHEVRISLAVIRDTIRRMSAMPGQRTIILASPGFITNFEAQPEKTDITDRAIRANVIISTVDARGLWTDPSLDASRPGAVNAYVGQVKSQYDRDSARSQADILAELALGTGGKHFENSNDFDRGFKEVATAPEYLYILGYSPQNLKYDGSFHALKVAVKAPDGLTLSARRGYYAPRHLSDAEETAKAELQEAVFSREEMHELPVDMHTQFFKASDTKASVTVITHFDLKHLRLRKLEGRNYNKLTIVSALFDRNGNYVIGNQKMVELRLKDETIERRAEAGFSVRSSFDVKPGIYLVRLVVRDAEGQLMSAANGAVEIP